MKWLRDLLTEADNATFDMSKVLACFAILSGLYYQGVDVLIANQHFDMQNFGMGIGALFAGVGVALGLKKENGAA